jgi:hypothetical protein
MSSDAINGIAVENVTRECDYDVILACQDRCIRLLSGSQCSLEIPVTAAVTAVTTLTTTRPNGVDCCMGSTADVGESKMIYGSTGILYGMDSGSVGFVNVLRGGSLATSWVLKDDLESESSAVTGTFHRRLIHAHNLRI